MKRAVAILGAGTQGRRLAYMVSSITFPGGVGWGVITWSQLTLHQWSSRGRPVNLIDRQPAALQGALDDIEKFKSTVGKKTGHQGGEITTFGEGGIQEALQGAWLAVEVR